MTKLLKTYFYGGSAVFTQFLLSLVSGKPIESVFVGYHIHVIQSVRGGKSYPLLSKIRHRIMAQLTDGFALWMTTGS